MPNTFARGVAKTVTICPETSFGTANTTAGAGQLLRRTTSDLNININQIESQEILPSQQVRDSRNGPRTVQGTISGQLSCATYSMLFQGLLRNTFQSVAATAALGDVSAVLNGTTGNLDITGSAGDSFVTKFKLGDVLRVTGVTGASGTADNGNDMRVVAITAGTMSLTAPVGSLGWTAGAPGEVFTFPGKKLLIPATGQIDQSYSIEHFYSDIGQSELFTGCKITSITMNFPASGFVTLQASVTGQQMTAASSQQLPSPAAITTTTGLTAVSGKIAYTGNTLGYITAMNLQIMSNVQPVNVVGNNLVPAIFLGTVMVKGSITALNTVDTLTADFLAENEVDLSVLCTTGPAGSADFVSVYIPRVKLTSSTKSDSPTAITRSYNFVGLENSGSKVGADLTSIVIQDSLTP